MGACLPYCRQQDAVIPRHHPGSGDGSLAGGGALGRIKIEIHRAQAVFQIGWPAAESAGCARWARGAATMIRPETGLAGSRASRYVDDDYRTAIQQIALGRSPCDGTTYAFSQPRQRIKLLVGMEPGSGCVRRLHQGASLAPQRSPIGTLSAAEWQWLVRGVDWRRLQAKPPRMPGRSEPAHPEEASVYKAFQRRYPYENVGSQLLC